MIRRSWVLLSKAKGRTVVRDPRKAAKKASALAVNRKSNSAVVSRLQENNLPADPNQQSPLPFQPSHENQQSVGSSLVSYGLAGVGVAMGVTLVRVVLGF